MIVVVMGVSGAGKTTVGRRLADSLALPFLEADDFHPPANVAKMQAGLSLDDADREPWLRRLAVALAAQEASGGGVLACSALRERYRRTLGAALRRPPTFVYLHGDRELLRARLAARANHFMPPALLDSQLATLEVPADALSVDVTDPPEVIVRRLHRALAAPA